MPKLAFLAAVLAASSAGYGCLSSSGSSPNGPPVEVDGSTPEAGPPVQTFDGSVVVDGATTASLTTGLGSGIVAHSAHFTLITKTGQEPGGAGIKGSSTFKIISGAGTAAAKK